MYGIIIAIKVHRIVEYSIKYILKIRSNRILKLTEFNSIRFDIYSSNSNNSTILSRAPASGPGKEGKSRRVSITTIQS
jgi:hypothetical protein